MYGGSIGMGGMGAVGVRLTDGVHQPDRALEGHRVHPIDVTCESDLTRREVQSLMGTVGQLDAELAHGHRGRERDGLVLVVGCVVSDEMAREQLDLRGRQPPAEVRLAELRQPREAPAERSRITEPAARAPEPLPRVGVRIRQTEPFDPIFRREPLEPLRDGESEAAEPPRESEQLVVES